MQYHLATDASKTGAGGVLFQVPALESGKFIDDKHWDRVEFIMFLLFAFSDTEIRYTTTEREGLILILCLEEVRWLVCGSPYPVLTYTDHSALLHILNGDDVYGRLARWQTRLTEYWLYAKHVPGKTLVIADGLSRIAPEDQYRALLADDDVIRTTDLTPDDPEDLAKAQRRKQITLVDSSFLEIVVNIADPGERDETDPDPPPVHKTEEPRIP